METDDGGFDSPRITDIQMQMAERCLELLNLPAGAPPQCILDIGCGTGFSSAIVKSADHFCVGSDIAESMLLVGQEEDEEDGVSKTDTVVNDIGQGSSFSTCLEMN